MPRIQRDNYIKLKVWGKDSRSEISGPIAEGISLAFYSIASAAEREKALSDMQKTHSEMLKREQAADKLRQETQP